MGHPHYWDSTIVLVLRQYSGCQGSRRAKPISPALYREYALFDRHCIGIPPVYSEQWCLIYNLVYVGKTNALLCDFHLVQ